MLAAKAIIYVTISLASVMLGFVVLMTLFELPFRAEPTQVLLTLPRALRRRILASMRIAP